MTFGAWWELLSQYRYGITYDIANKVIKYLQKYQSETNISINLQLQEQVLGFAHFNEYGMPKEDCGMLPENYNVGGYSEYGF